LRVQRLLGTGAPAPGWPVDGVVVSTAPGVRNVHLVADGSGGAFLAWNDVRSDADGDLFAAHLVGNGALDPNFAAGGGRVAGGAGRQGLGDLIAAGAGSAIVGWQDERAGAANADVYAQRLLDAVTAVEDGPRPRATLVGFVPNPSRAVPTVAFTLADDRGGSLDVLDPQGRRVAGLDLGRFAPGPHRVTLAGQ